MDRREYLEAAISTIREQLADEQRRERYARMGETELYLIWRQRAVNALGHKEDELRQIDGGER